MENFESMAINTFQNNIQYFEKNHPDLHRRILAYEAALELQQYTERYSLEYLDGYFDVKDLSTETYLYNTDSNQYSSALVDTVGLKRTGHIFEALSHIQLDQTSANIIDVSQLTFHNTLWATAKIIRYNQDYTQQTNNTMNNVSKIIVLGLGLGLHLQNFKEKMGAQVLFIQEDDFELFKLSLFTCDYAQLATNATLYFSIMEETTQYRHSFISFLDEAFNHNSYLKYIPFFGNYETKTKELQQFVLSQNHIMYPYNAFLLRYLNAPRYLVQEYAFIDVSKRRTNNIFSQKPVLIIASGPSTDKNMQWIKANHHRFIIVSMLSTCRLLQKHDIKPDIVMHIDPGIAETDTLFSGLGEDYFDDMLLLFASNVDTNTVSRFKREQLFFIEQSTQYKKNFSSLTAPSVGEYTYALLLVFGVKELYLLGIDLALDADSLQSHSGDHPFAVQGTKDETLESSPSLSINEDLITVKGNFRETIPTLAAYNISINEFSNFSKTLLTDNENIYNLSDGAYLHGATPASSESINTSTLDVLDKSTIYTELHNFFVSISNAEFRDDDKKILVYQLKEAKKLRKIIKNYTRTQHTQSGEYLTEVGNLLFALSDMQGKSKSDLSEVFYYYFKISYCYITDLFNTQDLPNIPDRIQEINTILINQIEKISSIYIESLEEYLE